MKGRFENIFTKTGVAALAILVSGYVDEVDVEALEEEVAAAVHSLREELMSQMLG